MEFIGFPLVVGWELTLQCNLRCRHCGSNAGLPRENELNLEESLAICDQFNELLVNEVDFTGGEPLLRQDWPIIAKRLKEMNITVKMVTNGTLLSQSTVAELKETGIDGIAISLDGRETIHDYIRGSKGLFKKVVQGMTVAIANDLPITAVTAVNALNVSELPFLFDLLHNKGINKWQIQPMFPLGRSKENSELSLTEKDYMSLGMIAKNLVDKSHKAGLEIRPGDSLGFYTELDTRDPKWKGCNAGIVECGITSDGKIKGCLALPDEFVEGDLRKQDLWEIWFNSKSFSYTRNFSLEKLGPNCNFCVDAIRCQGGCSAMSIGNSGIFHNDLLCFTGIRNRRKKLV